MNLRTKKIIAKEIIYLFSGIIILLMIWVIMEIQNVYYQNKVNTYKNEITQLQIQMKESVIKPILQPDKLKKLNDNAKIMFESGSSEEDILAMKDAFLKRFGRKHTLNEKIKLDKLKNSEITKNNELKKTYLKILNKDDVSHNIKFFSIIIFVLLYPIRIIYILVKWAIKTLKIKN